MEVEQAMGAMGAVSTTQLPRKIEPQPIMNMSLTVHLSEPDDHGRRLHHLQSRLASAFDALEIVPASSPPVGSETAWFPFATLSMSREDSSASIKPDAIELDYGSEYPGWATVGQQVEQLLELLSSELRDQVERVSMRYLNFFPNVSNLAEAVDVEVNVPSSSSLTRRWVRFQIEEAAADLHDITCADNVKIGNSDEQGVILDITSALPVDTESKNTKTILKVVDALHLAEKRVFMSLIKSTLLSRYEVTYS